MGGISVSEADAPDAHCERIRARGPSLFRRDAFCGWHVLFSAPPSPPFVGAPVVIGGCLVLCNGPVQLGEAEGTAAIQKIIRDTLDANPLGEDLESHFSLMEHVYLKLVHAEYAMVIVTQHAVCFFKDDVGTHSLGFALNPFLVSSVGYDSEMDPLRLYVYDRTSRMLHSIEKPDAPFATTMLARRSHIDPLLYYASFYEDHPWYPRSLSAEDSPGGNLPGGRGPSGDDVDAFECMFSDSMRKSIYMKKSMYEDAVVISFSGGVDSTILALFACMLSAPGRPIYLINTACEGAFDEKKGREAYSALTKKFPGHMIHLIENKLSLADIREHYATISELVLPKRGQMDINIGAVVYFTAKKAAEYGTSLLMGSGADELFCGYSKYSREYAGSTDGKVPRKFRDHLLVDTLTISSHNIARDDKAAGHFGVSLRLPFLDPRLILFSLGLAEDSLIRSEDGKLTNKWILRRVLRMHGLHAPSACPKKAMQYGSGISRHEGSMA